jgi:hypothetical protein
VRAPRRRERHRNKPRNRADNELKHIPGPLKSYYRIIGSAPKKSMPFDKTSSAFGFKSIATLKSRSTLRYLSAMSRILVTQFLARLWERPL